MRGFDANQVSPGSMWEVERSSRRGLIGYSDVVLYIADTIVLPPGSSFVVLQVLEERADRIGLIRVLTGGNVCYLPSFIFTSMLDRIKRLK